MFPSEAHEWHETNWKCPPGLAREVNVEEALKNYCLEVYETMNPTSHLILYTSKHVCNELMVLITGVKSSSIQHIFYFVNDNNK